jgi:hypothetical protein|tara:strand:+ start:144 stop:317 length:174 start_codon:yes stop_codon:yes gene_type:complete
MAITTKQEALEKMFPDDASKQDISYVLGGFDGILITTENQIKEELKKAFPNVTDWGF